MFSLDPANMQSNEAIFGLIAFFILNVMIHLFLVNKLLEEKRKNRILNKSAATPETSIIGFLSSQFSKTKSHNRSLANSAAQLAKDVVHLRSAYLKIEEKAIAKHIDSPEYWKYINENLLKLVKIIFPQSVGNYNEVAELERKVALLKERITSIPNSSKNKKVEQHKARAIASLEHIRAQPKDPNYNRATFQKQLHKLESIVEVFESPEKRREHLIQKKQTQYLERSEKHADQLASISRRSSESVAAFESSIESSDELVEELSRFKGENQTLAQQITQLKAELKAFKERMPSQDAVAHFIEHGEKSTGTYDLNDITDELIESNEKEINRLRDVIANQRSSIFEMEESLASLERFNQHDNVDQKTEMEKLKRCIQESEICISMLEQELDELKEDLSQLRVKGPGGDISAAESEALSDEVRQLKSEIEESHNQISAFEQLNRFIGQALSASSVEDVALLLYETIVSLNYAPQLLIKSPERILELTGQGSMSVRDKVVINNMQVGEVNPGAKGQLNFRFMQLAGMVNPPPAIDIDDKDQRLILKILKISDKIITLLLHVHKGRQHAKLRDETVNSIKHVSYDLDKLIEENSKSLKKVVARNFQQISDMARVRGMTATQVAAIHSIEQETLKQIETASSLRLKARKDFLKLIQSVEGGN